MSSEEILNKQENANNQTNIKLDYWWYKENYRQLIADLPSSRVNAARKIINSGQISEFKIHYSKTIKATINNLKKNIEITTELTLKLFEDNTIKQISDLSDEYHNGIIALINGELTNELYTSFCSKNGELFFLPSTMSWNCDCQQSQESKEHLCEHVLAVILKLLDECKYMPILYFQLKGFGLAEFKQLFFDLPVDDSGRAELPDFLSPGFYDHEPEKNQFSKDWLDDYYGKTTDYSETLSKELEPFREQRYYHHKFNHDFYDTLDALKQEIAKFWHTQS